VDILNASDFQTGILKFKIACFSSRAWTFNFDLDLTILPCEPAGQHFQRPAGGKPGALNRAPLKPTVPADAH